MAFSFRISSANSESVLSETAVLGAESPPPEDSPEEALPPEFKGKKFLTIQKRRRKKTHFLEVFCLKRFSSL